MEIWNDDLIGPNHNEDFHIATQQQQFLFSQ